MNDFQQTLQKYWGFSKFREMQEDIIRSIYEGNDTIGLLPTGGGKSICFQVPAMMKEGLCLVVTPLIALMKDQVENLNKKNIPAVMVSSGMPSKEIDITLKNCIHNPALKFLYLSPERLGTESFREILPVMNISFLVVDESHCISQWGYDFRPAYLKIAEIRELIPHVPVLALTATATPEVVDDIQERLLFKKKNVFKKSFERKNLTYIVRRTDKKFDKLIEICRKTPGTGIVYVRNRRRTTEIAEFLSRSGMVADYYHAGLDFDTRSRKQQEWKDNKTRIIVSTNAFGMGIDKPDVRFVVHMDLPDSLEAYYQEAGRGGRDEKKAWGVLLIDNADKDQLEKQVEISFPPLTEIRRVYNALGNFLQVPVEGGKDSVHPFSLAQFSQTYKLNILTTYNSLKLLEKENYISFTDEMFNPSKLMMLASKMDLYNFQIKNQEYDPFIKFLIRSYSGIFTYFVKIDESSISKKLKVPQNTIRYWLLELKKYGIVDYFPQARSAYVVYTEVRLSEKSVIFSPENYNKRKEKFIEKIDGVIKYAYSDTKCRSQMLRSYFGENDPERCGDCDVCKDRNELGLSRYEFDLINDELKSILLESPKSLIELVKMLEFPEDKTSKVIRWLLDHEKIVYNQQNCLLWNRKN